MKRAHKGFGGLQLLLLAATATLASATAVPQYQAFSDKARVTQGLDYARDSMRNVSRMFLETGRYPQNASEANALLYSSFSKPDFVRELRLETSPDGESVTIKVLLEDGIFDNEFGVEQYLFLESSLTKHSRHDIKWLCGTSGLDLSLLPSGCPS